MNSFELRQCRSRLVLRAGNAVAIGNQMPPDMQLVALLLIVLAALLLSKFG
jgi:hypothetical protein